MKGITTDMEIMFFFLVGYVRNMWRSDRPQKSEWCVEI